MDVVTIANFGAYCAQVLCMAAGAGVLLWALRINAPAVRYACLRATLVLCLLLPWLQPRHAPAPTAVAVATILVASPDSATDAAPLPPQSGVDWIRVVPAVLAAGAIARFLWLAIGLHRLHRMRREGEPADAADHAELQAAVGTRAEVRYVGGFSQPVTFGVWRPVVLLPERLRRQPAEVREAVLAHELVHVRRRDWAWVVVEELTRSIFWFHPALWWLISHIQQAREEVVDGLAVAHTGRRLVYMQALLAFADGIPLAPATAFARRRHLFRRMMLLSRENVMTLRRLVASSLALLTLMGLGGWFAASAFPLHSVSGGQILQQQPGPLEQAARPISAENPVPRRVRHEPAEYPREAAAANAWVSVTLKLTVDATGSVAEARVTRASLRTESMTLSLSVGSMMSLDQAIERASGRAGPGAASDPVSVAKPILDAAVSAAAAALERWRYEPPVHAPISFETTFYFAPAALVTDAPAVAADDRFKEGLRVGGNIKPPKKIKNVPPVYPPDAQEARVQGVVIIEARIDPEGRVSDARVLRSIPLLDQAALDAVRQWEFEPTLLNGVPTAVILTVTVQFTLA